MKKFLSLVLALAMTLSLVTISAGAKDFTDSDELSGEQYAEAVNVMSEMGIIDGYGDGDFRPQGTLTRGAAAKIIACMMLGKTTAEALGTSAAPFKDVPVGSTFAGYIAYCVESGLIDGYADGTFRPQGTLTGFAFLKMLLTALGYDSSIEGYTGANWTVNVMGRAQQVGLTAGNDEFVGSQPATREEACLYALNTLKATLVEYADKGQEIVVSDGTVINVRPSAPTYVTSNVYDAATSINDSTDNVKNGWTVEFAEKYQPDLELDHDTDDFMRPAHTWSWEKKEIGTYVDYDKMVAEYTTGVTGRDLYEVLTATTIKNNDLLSYVDGAKGSIIKNDLVRSNKNDLDDTDNGVLTQVFLDTDNEEITIASVNTYLATANADYSEDKEYAPLSVYTDVDTTGGKKDVTEKPYNVDVEDVPSIANVVEDGIYRVTISYKDDNDGDVITVDDVETLAESTVTKWSYDDVKVASKLTTDGTEYEAAAKAFYDAEELYDYDESLLTDMIYNIYLDQYGYILGVDLHEGEMKYVFITGYDRPKSNLSVSTAKAGAIFLDGSMEEISVNVKATNDNIDESAKAYFGETTNWNDESGWWNDGNPTENRWYSYSVNENGVYTLKPADMTITSYTDEMTPVDATRYNLVTIDTANVSVKSNVGDDTKTRVYGEDASVYITVESDVVDTTGTRARAITDVTGVYTGVQSVDLEVENSKAVIADLEDEAQVYTVYDDDNYIIGAVVVGDATGSTANIVYTLGTAKSEELRDGTYYWEFDVVMNGEIQTLTAKSKYDDVIDFIKSDADGIVELRFDADGYVVKAVNVTDIYNYYDAINQTTASNPVVDDITDCDVYYVENPETTTAVNPLELNLKGRTMYITANQADFGLAIAKDAKAVVIQNENGKKVKTEFDSVEAAITRVADQNVATPNVLDYNGRIFAVLNSNGTAAWVVFDNDSQLVTGSNEGYDEKNSITHGDVTLAGVDLNAVPQSVRMTSAGLINYTFAVKDTTPQLARAVANAEAVQYTLTIWVNGKVDSVANNVETPITVVGGVMLAQDTTRVNIDEGDRVTVLISNVKLIVEQEPDTPVVMPEGIKKVDLTNYDDVKVIGEDGVEPSVADAVKAITAELEADGYDVTVSSSNGKYVFTAEKVENGVPVTNTYKFDAKTGISAEISITANGKEMAIVSGSTLEANELDDGFVLVNGKLVEDKTTVLKDGDVILTGLASITGTEGTVYGEPGEKVGTAAAEALAGTAVASSSTNGVAIGDVVFPAAGQTDDYSKGVEVEGQTLKDNYFILTRDEGTFYIENGKSVSNVGTGDYVLVNGEIYSDEEAKALAITEDITMVTGYYKLTLTTDDLDDVTGLMVDWDKSNAETDADGNVYAQDGKKVAATVSLTNWAATGTTMTATGGDGTPSVAGSNFAQPSDLKMPEVNSGAGTVKFVNGTTYPAGDLVFTFTVDKDSPELKIELS